MPEANEETPKRDPYAEHQRTALDKAMDDAKREGEAGTREREARQAQLKRDADASSKRLNDYVSSEKK
jgi:hypothetical protein